MHLGLFKKAFVNLYFANTDSSNETLSEALTPYIENLNSGWVGTGNGVWTPENPTKSYSDVYSVLGGHKYFLTLGETVGTRFRVMFSSVDVSTASSAVSGTAVNTSDYNNPAPYQNLYYTPNEDGYIIVQKDNVGNVSILLLVFSWAKLIIIISIRTKFLILSRIIKLVSIRPFSFTPSNSFRGSFSGIPISCI